MLMDLEVSYSLSLLFVSVLPWVTDGHGKIKHYFINHRSQNYRLGLDIIDLIVILHFTSKIQLQ